MTLSADADSPDSVPGDPPDDGKEDADVVPIH